MPSIRPPAHVTGRAKGHLPDPVGLVMTPHTRLLGLPTAIPKAVDNSKHSPPKWDQKSSSSCVGQATARAISNYLRLIGEPLDDEPSPLGLYTNARVIDRIPHGDVFPELKDDGSMPLACMRAIPEFGVPMSRDWPFDLATINDEPTIAREETASIVKLTGYYRIYQTPSNPKSFVEAVCQAIAQGFPVCFAIQADRAFEDYRAGTTLGAAGASMGGHYVCATGYDSTAGGSRVILVENSWGTSWGDHGNAHGDEAFMRGMSDVVIMKLKRAEPMQRAA
jgi:hypothetical protein